MDILDTADDVLAVSLSDRITGDELDRIMDRLDAIMAHHDKVHVFVQTHSIDGIELKGLGAYMARAMPLLGKLNRFGRVAVVADQAWIRAATKLESAVLPFISYRVFEPQDRDAALAWVSGTGD
ncbi:STAS/SEC14 domain-containing protein [Sphingopyxis sp. YF1]|uniref:STAS/SEC14 domain-containing protein n=1 Tax=Sphingopyxis sp. YF1 TaxID=2482763 RepID=UPI001F618A0C|nr:STAS/SEC14 domain-containing protein [Sphingopyxis sp. YF1]UNU41783.1 STAS/SEC14 domain-containing protein [Sphingopyxis sp. YF1]